MIEKKKGADFVLRSFYILLYRIIALIGSGLIIGGNELILVLDELLVRLATSPTPRTVLVCLSCWALYKAFCRIPHLVRSLPERISIRLESW